MARIATMRRESAGSTGILPVNSGAVIECGVPGTFGTYGTCDVYETRRLKGEMSFFLQATACLASFWTVIFGSGFRGGDRQAVLFQ